MAKAGRKGKFEEWITEEGLLIVKGWARDGLSNKQIAENIGVHPDRMCEWQNRFPEFRKALKDGRKPVQISIEDAFYKQCGWREVVETKEEKFKEKDGRETIKLTTTKRQVPPDTTALIFALKNLLPERYKDKHENVIKQVVDKDTIDNVEAIFNGL